MFVNVDTSTTNSGKRKTDKYPDFLNNNSVLTCLKGMGLLVGVSWSFQACYVICEQLVQPYLSIPTINRVQSIVTVMHTPHQPWRFSYSLCFLLALPREWRVQS